MKFERESEEIIKYVGGKENIISLVHCAKYLNQFQVHFLH